jgi:hypothetical protein
MSITQFNATYSPEEDRVLFRFNTAQSQEYRLWLTRLVVRDLLSLGAQASVAVLAREHPPEQAKAIAEFKQQVKVQEAKFTTFVPATQFPLGAEPLLVSKVRLTLEAQLTALEMQLPKGQLLTLRLTEEMIGQLRLLLQTIEQRAQWGLGAAATPTDATQAAATDASADTSAGAGANPTKVLH